MPYYINNECIGCTICAKKCPVPCIWGGTVHEWAKTKEFHIINPPDCIECGVCSYVCPSQLPLLEGIRKMKQYERKMRLESAV